MNEEHKINFKTGYVALVGRPNVGKSTLMNEMLSTRLSIVTPKPQTTRHRVLGIHNDADCQIIFFDTPGLLEPKYKLHELMVKTARQAMNDADVILFMIEPPGQPHQEDVSILEEIARIKKPIILIINKIDLIGKDQLLPQLEFYARKFQLTEIIPISAINRDGLDIVLKRIQQYLPVHPPFYPPDVLTEQPERFFVGEIVREKIFEFYEHEIPYSTTVIIEEFKEREHSKDYIRAAIYVERASQKGIIIGKDGKTLKNLGQKARQAIEQFLERPVFLELYVGVKEKWRSRENMLRELGYR